MKWPIMVWFLLTGLCGNWVIAPVMIRMKKVILNFNGA